MTTFGRTWIVVLDDARARFLRRESAGVCVPAAAEIGFPAAKATTPEARRSAREQFGYQVMSALDHACDRNHCDSIIVVAPERLLRRFRSAATDRVRVRLWRERAAEVASLSDDGIAELVERYFRRDAS